ncbi:hypothetical protein D9M72_605320 [compost metagenome]
MSSATAHPCSLGMLAGSCERASAIESKSQISRMTTNPRATAAADTVVSSIARKAKAMPPRLIMSLAITVATICCRSGCVDSSSPNRSDSWRGK